MREIQIDVERLNTDLPLVVDYTSMLLQWHFDRKATVDLILAQDLPAALSLELARAYLRSVLPPRTLLHLKPRFGEAHRIWSENTGAGLPTRSTTGQNQHRLWFLRSGCYLGI